MSWHSRLLTHAGCEADGITAARLPENADFKIAERAVLFFEADKLGHRFIDARHRVDTCEQAINLLVIDKSSILLWPLPPLPTAMTIPVTRVARAISRNSTASTLTPRTSVEFIWVEPLTTTVPYRSSKASSLVRGSTGFATQPALKLWTGPLREA